MEGQLFGDEGGAGEAPRVDPAAPLAVRMRPRTLEELAGQEHLLAPGSALRTAIETGTPHSMVLYGPPGTGKTTLARLVAGAAGWAFEEESAVNAGRAEVRAVIGRAAERRAAGARPTVFFLDEIHRFNKAQQDALLPAVEDGLITLIGATTENPYFEVNSALLSRCQIYELEALGPERVEALLRAALADPERGIADPPIVADDALTLLATRSGGDARTALGALERAVQTVRSSGAPMVDVAVAEDALQRKAVGYDKGGDRHYDYISAWIKATRGSDPDASIYYLAAMLEGGEDVRFIARRMVILASEDIGNADPRALLVATAAADAVDRVGLPECRLNLAQAARLPGAGAEVERAPIWRWAPPPITSAATARPSRPRTCATATTPVPRSSAAGSATSTRTTRRTPWRISRWPQRASRASASTRRPTAAGRHRRRRGSARSARGGADRADRPPRAGNLAARPI